MSDAPRAGDAAVVVPSAAGPEALAEGSGGSGREASAHTGGNADGSSSRKAPRESISYSAARVIGNGSFGVVFQATVRETGETVAIKKVLQDKRYKNRELQIMRMLDHTNVVQLKHCFYSSGDKPDEVYLNLVLEFIPETVYRVSRHYGKVKKAIPVIYIKLYIYQLLRALAYIHSLGISHRDIKPPNLLLDPSSQVLKLCDFGSAKILVAGEPNISYICSRYYRAPELIFGATDYLPAIDVWSTGCVMAELMIGHPLFPGESGVDQLVEIIKVLGTPSKEEIQAMNPNYTEFKFPQIKPHPWAKVFRSRTTPDAIDLVAKMLQYNPSLRLKPMDGLTHAFFDELRNPETRLPNSKPLPPLFDFNEHEFHTAGADAERILPSAIFAELREKYGPPGGKAGASAKTKATGGAAEAAGDAGGSTQGGGSSVADAAANGTGGGH